MRYQKPEVARLGKATDLILGCKVCLIETFEPETPQDSCDSELDD